MPTHLMKFRQERKGWLAFVKLLAVVSVIGVLVVLAIPAFFNLLQRADDSAVQSAVKSYVNAVESHLASSPNDDTVTIAEAKAKGARLSDGVTILVSSVADGYVVCGWHSNGKDYKNTRMFGSLTSNAYVFHSVEGIYKNATCPTAAISSGSPPVPNFTSSN